MYLTDRIQLDIEELNIKYRKTPVFNIKERKEIHEQLKELNTYLIQVATIEMLYSEISVN